MPRKSTPKKRLIPADLLQCQAEIPNGNSFMTLGGRPALERCKNKPTVVVIENKPGPDGRRGSMSLCGGCLAQFRKQMPKDYAAVKDITDNFPPGWRKFEPIRCDICDKPAEFKHTAGGLRCATCPRPEQ